MSVVRATSAFEFVKGEDAEIDWTIQTSATNTAPASIGAWTFAMKIKRKASDSDPSVITPTFTITDGVTGQVKAVFTAATMALLKGDYVYSLWRTNSGSATCLSTGRFTVLDTTQN